MKQWLLSSLLLLGAVATGYAQFNYSSIDFPGGDLTTARGINNHGDIVGSYRIKPPRHALLISDGNFIPLAPGSILATHFSEAWKSNNRGDVVGEFVGDDGFTHGFLFSDGALTTLDFPGASDTLALGINESGTVVGFWDIVDAFGNTIVDHGFTWKDGQFSQIDFPGAADSAVFGINARGDLVGGWDSGITSPFEHGFVISKHGATSFDVPGATITQADDINASGDIVGTYINAAGDQHGFLLSGTTLSTIDFPGAAGSSAWGINSAGQIVGNYRLVPAGVAHGFIAQPEEKQKPH
jgi:probable HAF family extracellular repeat protein